MKITVDGVTTNDNVTLASPSLAGVEVVSVRNVADLGTGILTVNVNGVGATGVINDRSTEDTTFATIGAADVTVNGDGAVSVGITTIDVGGTSVTDAFTLNISNGVKGGAAINVVDAEADWTAATINSTGAANTVGAINLSGSGAGGGDHTIKDLTINASAALASGNITGFDTTAGVTNTITVSGSATSTATAAAVSIGTLAGAIDVVNAAGLTAGGVQATLNNSTTLKFTGGAGEDRITTGGVSYAGADTVSIDAGAGTDRLIVVNTTDLDAAVEGAKFTNFEVLQVENGVNVDLNFISGITAVRLNDAAGNTGFTDLSATQAAAITVVAATNADTDTDGSGSDTDTDGELTISVKNAATVGQIDTVKMTIDDGAAAAATLSLGSITLANIENLEITAVDNVTVTSLTNAAQLTSIVLKGAGTQNIATGAVNFALNTSIDGSAATGALTIDLTGADAGDTSGVAIKGGSAIDNITGGGQADVITGGKGNDVLGGGAGNDTYVFEATGADNGDDTLTVVANADILQFKAFLSGGAVAQNGGAGTAITAYTSGSTADFAIAGKVALYSDATETNIDQAAEIAALIDGAGDAFSITAGGKAILITGDAGGANDTVNYWFINDANSDGDVADATEVVLVGHSNAAFDLDTLTTANFAFA